MENKVLEYMKNFSQKDLSEFDHVLDNFGKNADITKNEYERIYKKVMEKAGFEGSVSGDRFRKQKIFVNLKRFVASAAVIALIFLSLS